MNLYEEFLLYIEDDLNEYFQNVQLFENQFMFTDFNRVCYQKMFTEQRDVDPIKTIAELKKEIDGLTAMYKKSGDYYLKKRNNSKKGLDVQMGIHLENLVISFLNDKFKLKVVHGDTQNKKYPDCMVLGSDRGILAYFEVKYHNAPFFLSKNQINREPYEGSATLDYDKVKKQIDIIDSELDRPTFYLHWIDYPDLKGMFFETSNQVKQYIYKDGAEFERASRSGDYILDKKVGYTKKIYSPLFNMGTFEEFVNMLIEMKMNGVKQTEY